jgi:hypothetical protein
MAMENDDGGDINADGDEGDCDCSSRYWQEAQALCRIVNQRLADTQSQAKRLLREFQHR